MSNRSHISTLSLERCGVECLHPEQVTPLLGRVLEYDRADRVAATFSVLADPTRARLLHALSMADELCVLDLSLLLGISQSALSHQLRPLRDRNVVARTRRGRVVYYRLADEHVRRLVTDGLRHAGERVGGPPRAGSRA